MANSENSLQKSKSVSKSHIPFHKIKCRHVRRGADPSQTRLKLDRGCDSALFWPFGPPHHAADAARRRGWIFDKILPVAFSILEVCIPTRF